MSERRNDRMRIGKSPETGAVGDDLATEGMRFFPLASGTLIVS